MRLVENFEVYTSGYPDTDRAFEPDTNLDRDPDNPVYWNTFVIRALSYIL